MSDGGRSGGIGVGTVVGIVLVTLKVANVIDWEWWLVLLPFWIWIAIFCVGLAVYLPYLAISNMWKSHYDAKWLRKLDE